MNLDEISFHKFLEMGIFHNQTGVVKNLLKNEIMLSVCSFSKIYNESDVTVLLPEGRIKLPSEIYGRQLAFQSFNFRRLLKEIEDFEDQKTDCSTLYTLRDEAEKEAIDFENIENKERYIFEWLLVAEWVAQFLIDQGETVLSALGQYWWGISNLALVGACKSNLFKRICKEGGQI